LVHERKNMAGRFPAEALRAPLDISDFYSDHEPETTVVDGKQYAEGWIPEGATPDTTAIEHEGMNLTEEAIQLLLDRGRGADETPENSRKLEAIIAIATSKNITLAELIYVANESQEDK